MKTLNRDSIKSWNNSRRCSDYLTDSFGNFLVPTTSSLHSKNHLQDVKAEIESRIFLSRKWRHYGVQLTMNFSISDESLLQRIFELRRSLLLIDIYNLVFNKRYHHQMVYDSLCELIEKYNLDDDFKWMPDSLSMVLVSIAEHERVYQQPISPELLLSITKTS